MAYSPNSQQLAVAGESSTTPFGMPPGKELHLHGHTGGSQLWRIHGWPTVSGSVDGTVVYGCGFGGSISLAGAWHSGVCCGFSDGRCIVACESVIRVWEID